MKPGDEAAAAGSGSGDGAVAPPAGWGLPYRVLLSLGSLALTALMLLSVSDALLRSFLNAPLFGAQEVARMLLVATVAFGIPAATIVGQTISIDILTERLS
ncbi:MAG: TRAP transporter small permease subunit, partial [Alphaproteobacteria bacterium]|nr:TRAP transporter small permease subunit [Alphaproteobacteria bacterium]